MTSTFILGTYHDIPGTNDKNFVVLGTFADKNAAKASLKNFATAAQQDQYKNGIGLFELDHDKNHLYTFGKKELAALHEAQQLEQKQQLQQQKAQLEQQQQQLAEQINQITENVTKTQ